MRLKSIAGAVRYASHLPPSMLLGKVVQSTKLRLLPEHLLRAKVPDRDWNAAFSSDVVRTFSAAYEVQGSRFEDSVSLVELGVFSFNGVTHSFEGIDNVRWGALEVSNPALMRWEHDFSFFLFSIPLVRRRGAEGLSLLSRLVRRMESLARDDPHELRCFHWSPIAVATRVMALCAAVSVYLTESLPSSERLASVDTSIAEIGRHVALCEKFLSAFVEKYLGFNHAVTTISGLALAQWVVGREGAARRNASAALRELLKCTLPDGMWEERSPSYHIHMMILADALASSGLLSEREQVACASLLNAMRFALRVIVEPDGEIAVVNDSAILDAPRPELVGWHPGNPGFDLLDHAGFIRLNGESVSALLDAGPMGPDSVIGHAHADFLSVSVSAFGLRFLVDPGVASVRADAAREWTRSAHSHNGPTFAEIEPAEFFGAWRVGRRGSATLQRFGRDEAGSLFASGDCDGYEFMGAHVSRLVRLDEGEKLTIRDSWKSISSDLTPISRFLIPDDWLLEERSESALSFLHPYGRRCVLTVRTGSISGVESGSYFPQGPMAPGSAHAVTACPSPSGLLVLELDFSVS